MKAVSGDKEHNEKTVRSFSNYTQFQSKWRLGWG